MSAMGWPRRGAVVAVLAAGLSVSLWTAPQSVRAEGETRIGRAVVVDGGTLTVDGRTVRLFGIVAPGAEQRCRAGALPWLCGAAAKDFLQGLVGGRGVACHLVSGAWARCDLGDRDVGLAVVSAGWAVADPATGDAYRDAEAEARAAKTGLWSR